MDNKNAKLEAKIKFIMLMAKALHRYGASADRIEKALTKVSNTLGVVGHYFSLPTGIIASFKNADNEHTRMERLEPGKVNLAKYFYVDKLVDQVAFNEISIEDGTDQINNIINQRPEHSNFLVTLSYAMISLAICIIFQGSWKDGLLSTLIGLFVGFFAERVREERIDSVSEAINAFFVTIFSLSIGYFYPSNSNIVVLSALITLVPGLMVTMAIEELSSQNLTSGTARLLGASMILLKISFGVFIANQIMKYFGFNITPAIPYAHPYWVIILMTALSGIAFTINFQARLRDVHWMILASFISFFSAKIFSDALGLIGGSLCAGTIIGAVSNLFARIKNRPVLIFQLPSIILLVPGSIGFKGLNLLFENNMLEGFHTIFNMATIGIALVSGTLFGSLLIKPKRVL